jgi:hypothetical protein
METETNSVQQIYLFRMHPIAQSSKLTSKQGFLVSPEIQGVRVKTLIFLAAFAAVTILQWMPNVGGHGGGL